MGMDPLVDIVVGAYGLQAVALVVGAPGLGPEADPWDPQPDDPKAI